MLENRPVACRINASGGNKRYSRLSAMACSSNIFGPLAKRSNILPDLSCLVNSYPTWHLRLPCWSSGLQILFMLRLQSFFSEAAGLAAGLDLLDSGGARQ